MRILEIGTFMGYSAICLAKGLAEKGEIHTVEISKEDAAIAANNFSKSLYTKQIILHEGNALDIIPALNETWDLIFIDADKVNYINYYELTLPMLKKGGFILADAGALYEDPLIRLKTTGEDDDKEDENMGLFGS